MRCSSLIVATALMAAAAGCQTASPAGPAKAGPSVEMGEPEEWRAVASPADEDRIDRLETLWTEAVEEARQKGFRRRIGSDAALLSPGGGLPRAAPAPGSYRCKAFRIGSARAGAPAYAAGRQGFCFVGVQEDRLSLTSEVPAARYGGHFWETERSGRLVFLGAAMPSGSRVAPAYGTVPGADVVGLIERLGEFRYRLVIATPADAQKLAVFELIAAPRD